MVDWTSVAIAALISAVVTVPAYLFAFLTWKEARRQSQLLRTIIETCRCSPLVQRLGQPAKGLRRPSLKYLLRKASRNRPLRQAERRYSNRRPRIVPAFGSNYSRSVNNGGGRRTLRRQSAGSLIGWTQATKRTKNNGKVPV